jgi:hypothetical protein
MNGRAQRLARPARPEYHRLQMKRMAKRSRTGSLLLWAVSVVVLSSWNVARADFLYWAAPTLKTGSVKTGYSFAQTALRNQGAQNLRVSANEVAGSIGRTWAHLCGRHLHRDPAGDRSRHGGGPGRG